MVTFSAQFTTGASRFSECPPGGTPEVAFVGRSNAGKSSMLNRLTGSKRLARVSKTPGRTRMLNFFDIAGGGRFVDLPGYGYASASKTARRLWGQAVDDYLTQREDLAAIVLVMDARHPLQPFDRQMLEWARSTGTPMLAVLNKCDKLKQGPRARVQRNVAQQVASIANVEVLTFSARTGFGAEALAQRVAAFLGVVGRDWGQDDP